MRSDVGNRGAIAARLSTGGRDQSAAAIIAVEYPTSWTGAPGPAATWPVSTAGLLGGLTDVALVCPRLVAPGVCVLLPPVVDAVCPPTALVSFARMARNTPCVDLAKGLRSCIAANRSIAQYTFCVALSRSSGWSCGNSI